MSFPHDIKLSPKLAEILLGLVELAEKEKTVTAHYNWVAGDDVIRYDLQVGEKVIIYDDLKEEIIFPLSVLEFIHVRDWSHMHGQGGGNLVLAQQAFEWAKYQRKSRLGKVLYRSWQTGKQNIAILVTAIVTAITTALAIIQILQLLNWP
ncbi:hypothetical protein BH24BAC1_BH24BAC1_40770 [soil metagenome]